jgi:hypothetical protein
VRSGIVASANSPPGIWEQAFATWDGAWAEVKRLSTKGDEEMEQRLFWWAACDDREPNSKGTLVSGPHLVVAWSEGEVRVMAGAALGEQAEGLEVVVVPFA